MTLHRSIGVLLSPGVPVPLLERGTDLPASGSVVLRTGARACRGTSDPIAVLELIEDDGSGLYRAPVVGTLRMSAERARRDVPAGSAVQVGVTVDPDRRARLEAYVPVLDEDESVTVTLASGPAAAPSGAVAGPPDRRTVALVGEIDEERAESVMEALLELEDATSLPAYLHIDSPGGPIDAGMIVYDTMRFMQTDVVTRCTGHAGGIAQVLLSAGAPGRRSIRRDGSVRMVSPSAPGPPTHEVRQMQWKLAKLIAEHTGRPLNDVRADVVAGRLFTAAEALEYGLVDRIDDGSVSRG